MYSIIQHEKDVGVRVRMRSLGYYGMLPTIKNATDCLQKKLRRPACSDSY